MDISSDYTIFDNPESVIVTLKGSGGDQQVTIDNALRGTLTRREADALGLQLSTDGTAWFIPNAQLTADDGQRTIELRDTITAGSEAWTVENVVTVRMGSSVSGFRCLCTKQV